MLLNFLFILGGGTGTTGAKLEPPPPPNEIKEEHQIENRRQLKLAEKMVSLCHQGDDRRGI